VDHHFSPAGYHEIGRALPVDAGIASGTQSKEDAQ
jgi:hypothetical protein